MLSRKTDEDLSNIVLKMDGKVIKRTDSPKLLGINLDVKLNFQKHVNANERKASNTIGRSKQINAQRY